MNHMQRKYRNIALGFLAAAYIIIFLLLHPTHGYMLDWDEVDYTNAARLGVWNNAFEQGSLTTPEFIHFARYKRDLSSSPLPGDYNEDKDPIILRHYHPPLITYATASSINLFGMSDRVVRLVQLVGAFVLIGLVFSIYVRASPEPSIWGMIIVLASAIWVSYMLFQRLSFHGWESIWLTCTAFSLLLWLGDQKNLVKSAALCLSIALAFLTLETGFFIWLCSIITIIIYHRYLYDRRSISKARILVGSLVIMLLTFILWPGSLTKSSLLRIPALYIYRLIQGEEYANVANIYVQMAASISPMIIGIAFCWLNFIKGNAIPKTNTGTYLLLGSFYTIIMLPFVLAPRYILASYTAFIPVLGLYVDHARSLYRSGLVLITTMLVTMLLTMDIDETRQNDKLRRADLQVISQVLQGKHALAEGAHIYRFYQDTTIDTISIGFDRNSILKRDTGNYVPFTYKDIRGKVLVINTIVPTDLENNPVYQEIKSCSTYILNLAKVYDCSNNP
jgi:hypothetical protein